VGLLFCICSKRPQEDSELLNSISHYSKKGGRGEERERERERERNFAKKGKSGTNEV
jgi:hypothetical protein